MTETPMTDLPELLKAATPGPWSVKTRNPNCYGVWSDIDGRVAYTAISQTSARSAEGEANAALCALAPTLAALVLEARTALDATAAKLDTALETLAEAGDCDKNCLACIDAREVLTDARTTLAKLGDL